MRLTKSNISVIIPVYNEENRIADCLEALLNQEIPPKEIIVVNNNCQDNTIAIARKFKNVKIVNEVRQGMIPARNRGFNIARGKILARIDADAIAPKYWTKIIESEFNSDPGLSALSGYGYSRSGISNQIIAKIVSWSIYTFGKALFATTMLWGSNMAIRKDVWQKIYSDTLQDGLIHEDVDVALTLSSHGEKVATIPDLVVNADLEEVQYFEKFYRYFKMNLNNKSLHKSHPRFKYHSIKKFNYLQRLYFFSVSCWFVGLMFTYTFTNSIYRQLKIRRTQLSSLIIKN